MREAPVAEQPLGIGLQIRTVRLALAGSDITP